MMPRTDAPPLSREALNRATLARQMLLARERTGVGEAVARLAGMQAQVPKPPFIGLWTRLEGFSREDLARAVAAREVVRGTLHRGTLHLVTRADFLAWRPVFQPLLTRSLTSRFPPEQEGFAIAAVLEAAQAVYAEHPVTFTELRDRLLQRFPEVNERALGFTVRMLLPLVMVPDGSPWAYAADAAFTPAETWLGVAPGGEEAPDGLVRRYLSAFGPASVADAQTWSGLKGLKPVFESLRGELVTFRDARGRELFDLPEAPRPAAETPVPVRFLPEYDNLVLAHDDRSRLVAEAYRSRIVTKNLKVLATFLVEGQVAGTWAIERKGKRASLAVEPFEPLDPRHRRDLVTEAESLLAFAEEDAMEQSVILR